MFNTNKVSAVELDLTQQPFAQIDNQANMQVYKNQLPGYIAQPQFPKSFNQYDYGPQIDYGPASKFGQQLLQIPKSQVDPSFFETEIQKKYHDIMSPNDIILSQENDIYEDDAMDMIRSQVEQEALDTIYNLLRCHISDGFIAESAKNGGQVNYRYSTGESIFDPILGRQAFSPNYETKRIIVDIMTGEMEPKLWAFVIDEYDICNVNKDYVLDITEIDDFLNRLIDYAYENGGLRFPKFEKNSPYLQEIMNALETFTTPDPFDQGDKDRPYATHGTGPEHLGITFVKIRRALKHIIEDFNLMKLEIAQQEEQKCEISCCQWCMIIFTLGIALIIGLSVGLACSSYEKRYYLNQQSGFITPDFSRQTITPRPNFEDKLLKYRLSYYDDGAIYWGNCEVEGYWDDDSQVTISLKAEKEIMEATYQLHSMMLEAVERVVNDDTLLQLFNIDENLWPIVKKSWWDGQLDFQGRFDFSWDGQNPPKMLEFNGDTPSMTIESSVVQAEWFDDLYDGQNYTQANMMLNLIDQTFFQINQQCIDKPGDAMGMVLIPEDQEMAAQMAFFKDRFDTEFRNQVNVLSDIANMKLGYKEGCVPALRISQYEVKCVLSVYPKEFMIQEITKDELLKWDFKNLIFIEPLWKLIMSNKAILPLLWEMFPNHPNLVPAYYDSPLKQFKSDSYNEVSKNWVSKPLFGREGAGILLSNNYSSYEEFEKATENLFLKDGQSQGKSIYQSYWKLPEIQGRVIQLSSWVVGGQPASIMFRQGQGGQIFQNANPFVPHRVEGDKKLRQTFQYNATVNQKKLRNYVYGTDVIIPTQDFPYVNKLVDKLPAVEKGVDPKFIVPVKQWSSYGASEIIAKVKTATANKYTNQTIDEARKVKCQVEGKFPTKRSLEDTTSFINANPGFSNSKRLQEFGKFVRLINQPAIEGNRFTRNFYVVNPNGLIFVYPYTTSPYYSYYQRSYFGVRSSYRGSHS